MESSWLITAVLGLVIILIFYWWEKKNKEYWKKRGVPYFSSPPLIGIIKYIILRKKGIDQIFIDLYKNFEGEPFGGYFQFTSPVIVIRDPEFINHVLVKDFTHFEDRGPPIKNPDDLFSMNISNLTGDEWRNVRHKLTPTFTSGKLKMMFGSIKDCCDDVIEYISENENQDIDAREFILRYVMNVIGNIGFGLKINTLNEKDEQSREFFNNATGFFKPSLSVMIKLTIAISFPKIKELLRIKLIDGRVDAFFRRLTKDIIKFRESTDVRRNDFLHLMLEIKKKEKEQLNKGDTNYNKPCEIVHMDNEDKELMDQLKNTPLGSCDSTKTEIFTDDFLASQTFLFIAGGSETTAAVLSFVLYELTVNQEVQKKLQDEISNVLLTREFDYQAIKKMTYMEQCIYETLRLYPVGGILMRVCTNDYKIPGSEVVIEKGTLVNIPVIGLHKDPQYFPDPEKFNPDRFEDMEAIPKSVFFPFGGGPRICIAMRLAMLEMKIVLATILQNYSVILSPKTKLPLTLKKTSFLLHVDGGIWIKFQKRKYETF